MENNILPIIASIASLLALVVTVIGWWYTGDQQKKLLALQIKAEKEKEIRGDLQVKITKVDSLLNNYAKLSQLYRFRSNFSSLAAKDENGNYILETPEKFKSINRYFYTDQKSEEAFKQLKGYDIASLIDQYKVTILFESEEVNDILAELDPTNQLNELLRTLFFRTINDYDFLIEHPEHWTMEKTPNRVFKLINEQTEIRRELRKEIDKIIKAKIYN